MLPVVFTEKDFENANLESARTSPGFPMSTIEVSIDDELRSEIEDNGPIDGHVTNNSKYWYLIARGYQAFCEEQGI